MSLLKALSGSVPIVYNTPTLAQQQYLADTIFQQVGNEITLYPPDSGDKYVCNGYNINDSVYSIVSKNVRKCGQVRLYHSKVKKNEAKTLTEYNRLVKEQQFDRKMVKEIDRMRKSMIEDYMVDSPLTKLLNKPNRNQVQQQWIENIIGFRELQGEGNIWFNRGDTSRTIEMFAIPKPMINLVGNGVDPWEVLYYQFNLQGNTYRWNKDALAMWIYTGPDSPNLQLTHLRGHAPLYAAMVLVQAMNEGDKRIATSNANAGANAIATRTDQHQNPTPQQALDMRQQFDMAVNNSGMAGKVAMIAGIWQVHQLGFSVKEQALLEQHGFGFKRLARVFETPAGIFDEFAGTFDNQKQWERKWVYSKIAPMIYSLKGILNDRLLKEFDLDPERNLIDCDIMSLPELAEDLKDQIAAVQNAPWITYNEKRTATGYEPLADPNMDKIVVPSGIVSLEEALMPVGGGLDNEMNALNT